MTVDLSNPRRGCVVDKIAHHTSSYIFISQRKEFQEM